MQSFGSNQPPKKEEHRIHVWIRRPLFFALDYKSSEELAPGTFIEVPLGKHVLIACSWDIPQVQSDTNKKNERVDFKKLRSYRRIIPGMPPLRPKVRKFIDWVSSYYLAPPGLVLGTPFTIARYFAGKKEKTVEHWSLVETLPKDFRITPQRRRLLDYLAKVPALSLSEIAEGSGVGISTVRGLVKAGVLEQVEVEEGQNKPLYPTMSNEQLLNPEFSQPKLTEEQFLVARSLCRHVEKEKFRPILLEGVTGSGKTEVYFEAVSQALKQGKQVLIFIPEIALTSQFKERVRKRFGSNPLVWHSEMSLKDRANAWLHASEGSTGLFVGARSALFLPFNNLGLIIVDEEHENSYKQEETFVYNGRDMAIVRANIENVPVVLVSATPSLETRQNAEEDKYLHYHLTERFAGATLPEVDLIDMRTEELEKGNTLSPTLLQSVCETIERKEQVMLFLNRRGYAPLTLCRHCGHKYECPDCSASLVTHHYKEQMICHHCDLTMKIPEKCVECGAEDSMVRIGYGIEKVEEELRRVLPQARILCMTSDSMQSKEDVSNAIAKIENEEVDVVLGTQILAKGWDFPNLTLVGAIDADLSLNNEDLRASEKTVQLLHQVGGRAGRAQKKGRVLLQSFQPEHPALQALKHGNIDEFLDIELQMRKLGYWPPFGRLAALVISSETESAARGLSQQMSQVAPRGEDVQIMGPAPAPISRLRGRYRFRLLIKAKRNIKVQKLIKDWIESVSIPANCRIDIDVDPISFL